MQDLPTAAELLGVVPGAGRAEVRRAFRDAVRRERPDLGRMAGARLARLVDARDALVAAAPSPVRQAGAQAGAPVGGPHARRFEVPAAPVTGRLVDVYA